MERRDALRAVTALALGAAAAGCDPAPPASAPRPVRPAHSPDPANAAGPANEVGSADATDPAATVPPGELRHGPRDRPQVALTFHGQGRPRQVSALLDEVNKGGARITVLAVGTWLSANPALGRRILADGHELGNHTQHHADIKAMTPAQAYAEVAACAEAIKGVAGGIGRWFRPSQTQFATAMIEAAARRAGYPNCLSYDVDPRDFTDPGPSAIVAATLAAVRPGSIVSLHCGHDGTVAAIAPLLAGLRDRGLRPVTASELFA
ncbi:polysaccharide deacetylase family protein [Actinoplanes sp. CA-030573]|uniref:polysaccharide deacetylase family protein n=1 Tax=Actinoplanes sp. CA-030573 TaxID=3239898 RepID=UPI003D8E6043